MGKCSICGELGHNKNNKRFHPIKTESPEQRNEFQVVPVEESENESLDIRMLRDHINITRLGHLERILKVPTLKDAHIYCVINNISSQSYGPLLETYIIKKYSCKGNKSSDCIGDYTKNDENVECKVSLGGRQHNKFNYVQIRPSHNISHYLLTAYALTPDNVGNGGELFIFKVPKTIILGLICKYGNYAHGTISRNGPITRETVCSTTNTFEYSLRPKINDSCWKDLLPYRITEEEI